MSTFKDDLIAEQLNSILPDRSTPSSFNKLDKKGIVQKGTESIKANRTAQELAKLKYKEKTALKNLEASTKRRQELSEKTGLPLDQIPQELSERKAKAIEAHKQNLDTISAIEAQVVEAAPGANAIDVGALAKITPASEYPAMVNKALQLQGASRPEMAKLLSSLNINLSVRLSKTDTANLLACLLTCNITQLRALINNKKVPIAIKIIIRRLLEDEKLGNTEMVERLWTRLFGKEPLTQNDLPESSQIQQGIIPNTPISREAYVIIRDTLLK